MKKLIVLIFLLIANTSFGATGDIIYQNCTSASNCCPTEFYSESCNSTASNEGWVRTVETSGCYSGECLKLDAIYNTISDDGKYGAGSTSITVGSSALSGHDEITVTYYLKYDMAISAFTRGNVKQFIPYVGGTVRYGTIILPHFGGLYQSNIIGTFTISDWIDPVTADENSAYAVDNGDGTYYSWNGYTKGYFTGAATTVPGTTWVKMTHYMKLPTSSTATNGIVKIWLNNELLFDFSTAQFKDPSAQTTFSNLTFMSSSEAYNPFEHWMDELIIYEGYVPPVTETCEDYAGLCPTEADCTTYWPTYNWCAGDVPSCKPTDCSATCDTDADECSTESECSANWPAYNWCPDETPSCTSSACAECSYNLYYLCSDQSSCESAGRYWWADACRTISNPGDIAGSNKITSGNFTVSSAIDDWTLYNSSNVAITTNGVELSDSGTIAQDASMTVGTQYRFVADIISLTGTFIEWNYNDADQEFTSTGTVTGLTTREDGGDIRIFFKADTSSVAIVNNIALYETSTDNGLLSQSGSGTLVNSGYGTLSQ